VHKHSRETLQEALDSATDEYEWDVVRILLDKYSDLDCNKVFEGVATYYDDEDELLDRIWKYSNGSITRETLDSSLYQATDNEKESTVKYLLETCHASPKATGYE
jgi:hypothetical protein